MPRGREPGVLYSYRYDRPLPSDVEVQERVREAGAGVVDLDHLLIIAQRFGVLPSDVLVIELEPVDVSPGIELSAAAKLRIDETIDLVRRAVAEPLAPTIPERRRDAATSADRM
jgi:hypothetical protein